METLVAADEDLTLTALAQKANIPLATSQHDMWSYKSGVAPALNRLSILAALFTYRHAECLDRRIGMAVSAVAMVPSLKQRTGEHPLSNLLAYLPPHWQRVPLSAGKQLPADVNARREPDPAHFGCEVDLTGRHVVVFDDTWARGGHAQGAARRIRAAGAAFVSVLVMARFLDPAFDETATFVRTRLTGIPYDLEICPVTGNDCPTSQGHW